jgi:hypothetical protein
VAHKRITAWHAWARRERRVEGRPVVGSAVRLHRRLLHGFLVPLVPVAARVRGRTAAKGIATAVGRGPAGRFARASNEGPSDDATFH